MENLTHIGNFEDYELYYMRGTEYLPSFEIYCRDSVHGCVLRLCTYTPDDINAPIKTLIRELLNLMVCKRACCKFGLWIKEFATEKLTDLEYE